MAILVLFPLSAMGMNFEQDNPDDKVVRRQCAWELRDFKEDWETIGNTPLRLYDLCISTVEYQEKACQEESTLKESYDCRSAQLQAKRDKCTALYKKALGVVKNCNPKSLEKELREIEDQDSRCKSDCLDMQKKCYLRNEFLLSSRYAGGPDNREKFCGPFNYIKCRTQFCTAEYDHLKAQVKRDHEREKKIIEEMDFWNQHTKQKYFKPKI